MLRFESWLVVVFPSVPLLLVSPLFDKWFVFERNAYPLDLGDNTNNMIFGFRITGFNKKDYKTSYGYVDRNGVLKSIFEDMELDTPNSFFDAMLAYSLALQYKAKQNAISEGLVTLYQNAENQFFNSIPQDTFSNSRIQNVY